MTQSQANYPLNHRFTPSIPERAKELNKDLEDHLKSNQNSLKYIKNIIKNK